jgi:cyanophycin synthetase
MTSLNVNWIADYKGPNKFDRGPLIVCELRCESDISIEKLKLVSKALYEFTGIKYALINYEINQKTMIYDIPLLLGMLISKCSLDVLNEIRGYLKIEGAKRDGNTILIWIGYHRKDITKATVHLIIDVLSAIINKLDIKPLKDKLESLWQLCKKYHPDYQARILMMAADQMDIPYLSFLSQMRCWQFGWGRNSLKFVESHSEEDSNLGAQIARNKSLAKLCMSNLGAPIAKHILINNINSIQDDAEKIGFPCVLKPIDRGQSIGVTVNIQNLTSLKNAYHIARKCSQLPLMLESHIEGDVHRLLVVRGKFIAATCRLAAQVIGDGNTKLIDLIDQFNSRKSANMTPGSYNGLAPFDNEFKETISAQGFSENSIPAEGAVVRIRNIPLLSSGSQNKDVTNLVHPDTVFFIETIAETLSIKIAGFDFITDDISKSCLEKGKFLEFNTYPSLRGHLIDNKDIRNVGRHILGDIPKRLTSILVVSNNLSYTEYLRGLKKYSHLGWRFEDCTGIGSVILKRQIGSLQESINSLLINKKVSALLIICSTEEIFQHGLPLDKFDQSIVSPECASKDIYSLVNKYSNKTLIEKFTPAFLKNFKKN